jgi:hypothetical protein
MANSKHLKIINKNNEQSDEDASGGGGKGGTVAFREFIAGEGPLRDDLSTDEKKRLLAVHRDTHRAGVLKQKELRQQRQAIKEGRIPAHQRGLGSGGGSFHVAHPILRDKAQFSGVDRQVHPEPTEHSAETNQEKRDELEYQYRLRYAPENAPKHKPLFNPKPYFYR